jgi:hypothetical protein
LKVYGKTAGSKGRNFKIGKTLKGKEKRALDDVNRKNGAVAVNVIDIGTTYSIYMTTGVTPQFDVIERMIAMVPFPD